jgi:hypothetical protein
VKKTVDPMERIADALERIDDKLDDALFYIGRADKTVIGLATVLADRLPGPQ